MFSTFGFFGLHSAVWFVRGLVDVLKHGRPQGLRPGGPAYVRFPPFHRIGHAVLLVSFLGLALTGLPLKYSHTDWAKALAQAMGGFASTSFWHRFFALVTFACFVGLPGPAGCGCTRAAAAAATSATALLFGPDSPAADLPRREGLLRACCAGSSGLGPKPTLRSLGLLGEVRLLGRGGRHRDHRLDRPGACGSPTSSAASCRPSTLNIAQVIHSTQALLATGFVFAIHFFNTHLRPDKFPADMSVLTGLVSEEEFREERPEFYERLRREGELEPLRTTAPGRRSSVAVKAGGFVALAVGWRCWRA